MNNRITPGGRQSIRLNELVIKSSNGYLQKVNFAHYSLAKFLIRSTN